MNAARVLSEEIPLELRQLPAPSAQLRASVIIPARDESASIVAALDALAAQRDLGGEPLDPARFEILLLANNCRDDTASLARAWGAAHQSIALHVVESHFETERACVGYARRVAMNAACFRLHPRDAATSGPRAICSTDADTRVSPFWIAHILEELRLGADAVGGRILLARETGDQTTRKTYLLDTAYRLLAARLEAKIDPQPGDPWPRHFQFFGASMAIAPEVYARIGGLPRARCLEDMALEAELLRRDLTVRHSPHVVALTSARRAGRVETGLSTQLSEWATRAHWLVPSSEEIAWRARLKRQLRAQFFARELDNCGEIAAALEICPLALREKMTGARFFGALWSEVWESAWSNSALRAQWSPIGVEAALAQLRAMLRGAVPK